MRLQSATLRILVRHIKRNCQFETFINVYQECFTWAGYRNLEFHICVDTRSDSPGPEARPLFCSLLIWKSFWLLFLVPGNCNRRWPFMGKVIQHSLFRFGHLSNCFLCALQVSTSASGDLCYVGESECSVSGFFQSELAKGFDMSLAPQSSGRSEERLATDRTLQIAKDREFSWFIGLTQGLWFEKMSRSQDASNKPILFALWMHVNLTSWIRFRHKAVPMSDRAYKTIGLSFWMCELLEGYCRKGEHFLLGTPRASIRIELRSV